MICMPRDRYSYIRNAISTTLTDSTPARSADLGQSVSTPLTYRCCPCIRWSSAFPPIGVRRRLPTKPCRDAGVLDGGEDLGIPLAKVQRAGGTVLLGKTFVSKEAGFFAVFVDSEGNRLAFNSMG